jgi:hypothetical protein
VAERGKEMSAVPELLRVVGKRHELEVENEKLKAEVERLKVTVETQNLLSREEAKIPQRWMTEEEAENKAEAELKELFVRFDKQMEAEAEVERLRANLRRAIEIAEEFWDNQKQAVLVYHQELADELGQLKATFNQEKK